MLAPTTIFHTVISFITEHRPAALFGDVALSNFSQIFFGLTNFFLSASIGFCGLTAIIRAFRSDGHVGNFFVDMWRVVALYVFADLAGTWHSFPAARMSHDLPQFLSRGDIGIWRDGLNDSNNQLRKPQAIVEGPLAAFVPMKQLGTNGGGFYGMNSADPYENPTALTNYLSCIAMMLFPFALVLMFGRMLKRNRHHHGDFLGHDDAHDRNRLYGQFILTRFSRTWDWPAIPWLNRMTIPSRTAPDGKQSYGDSAGGGWDLPLDQHPWQSRKARKSCALEIPPARHLLP